MKKIAIRSRRGSLPQLFQLSWLTAPESKAFQCLPCCRRQCKPVFAADQLPWEQAAWLMKQKMTLAWSAPIAEFRNGPYLNCYHAFLNHSPEVIFIFTFEEQRVQRQKLPVALLEENISTRQSWLKVIEFHFNRRLRGEQIEGHFKERGIQRKGHFKYYHIRPTLMIFDLVLRMSLSDCQ